MLVLAYKGIEKFLDSPMTWDYYEKHVLAPYPAVGHFHHMYGLESIDELKEQLAAMSADDFRRMLAGADDERLAEIYGDVVPRCEALLPPTDEIDVCFFLAMVPGCVELNLQGRAHVLISATYDLDRIPLILAHEYLHALTAQRWKKLTADPQSLQKTMVGEGLGCFLTQEVLPDLSRYDALWMMKREAVDWCENNEGLLRETLAPYLNSWDMDTQRKFYIQGEGYSAPPPGFPEQTTYYVGYRVVEECRRKLSLDEVFSLNATELIDASGFFG